MSDQPASQKNNPLHGLTLEAIVTALVAHYGWEALGQQINIRCFTDNPSIKSSLKFLRKTPGPERRSKASICTSSASRPKRRSDAMAFKITYTYKKQAREIGYANDKFNSIYDAVAAAEGIDLTRFHAMEEQLAQVCRRDKKSVKDYRENYFKELGFSNIVIERDAKGNHAHPDPDGGHPAAGRLQHDTEGAPGRRGSRRTWLHRQRGLSMVGAGRPVRAAVRAGHSPQPDRCRSDRQRFRAVQCRSESGRADPARGRADRLIRQGEEGNWSWQGGGYQLFPWKGYVLKSGDHVLYHGDLTPDPWRHPPPRPDGRRAA